MSTELPPHLAPLAASDQGSSTVTRTPQRVATDEPASEENAAATDDVVLERLLELRRKRVPCVLCTVTRASGSSPRKAGAKMLVLADGDTVGTIGGGAIEHSVVAAARDALETSTPTEVEHHLTRELGMCCGGSMKVFVEPQVYAPALFVFGAGHVAQPLAEAAALAGFAVTVVDERARWADSARFPRARRVLCSPPLEVLDELPLDASSFAIVVTHDHGLDQDITEQLLEQPLTYLGVIGSVRKRERFRQRLAARGFDKATLERMRTPMGLDIGAVTPAEIAISVVAELVQVRRGREGETAQPMASLKRTRKRSEHD